MSNFNFLENLPVIIFSLLALIVFVLFIIGGIFSLTAKGDPLKTDRGRKFLFYGFWSAFLLVLVVIIFYAVNYFLWQNEISRTQQVTGEFPASASINFPPAPEFIKLGKYYFNGPFSLQKNDFFTETYIYAILCKATNEYVIIDVGEGDKYKKFSGNEHYSCWLSNCQKNIKNVYAAVIWTPSQRYNSSKITEIIDDIKKQFNPSCIK